MTTKNAFLHLLENYGRLPNRMCDTRFRRGKMSNKTMVKILVQNKYRLIRTEAWAPKKIKSKKSKTGKELKNLQENMTTEKAYLHFLKILGKLTYTVHGTKLKLRRRRGMSNKAMVKILVQNKYRLIRTEAWAPPKKR